MRVPPLAYASLRHVRDRLGYYIEALAMSAGGLVTGLVTGWGGRKV